MQLLAITLGLFFAYAPTFVAQGFAYIIGTFIYYFFPTRRRMMHANLYYCFPDKSEKWRKHIAIESCRRMVEMGLFIVASPFLSKNRIKKRLELSNSAKDFLKKSTDNEKPYLFLVPHFSLTESIALYRACQTKENDKREIGVIFRPLNNKSLDQWIKKTRERFGLKLLSRREGFSEAINILKRNGTVGILFDQNAGDPGILGTFFERLASTTQLPDLLANKTHSANYITYTERKGFWKAKIHAEKLPNIQETPLRISANNWLENKLKENDNFCSDWLWYHHRWRTQCAFYKRFRIDAKKMDIDLKNLKPKTQFWFRLPNWLGDVIMTLPLLKAVKKGRPDAHITLLAQKPLIPLLEKLKIADQYIALPPKNWKYFFPFWKLRKLYPDMHFLFTNSERGDLEALIIGAPQRFGMERPKKKRYLLTHTWKMPQNFDETLNHQTYTWNYCLSHFGLRQEPDLSPFINLSPVQSPTTAAYPPTIGLICGTENNPQKRWPVESWKALIELIIRNYPQYKIHLYGTANDKAITQQVAKDFDDAVVLDLAGRTDLIKFAEGLTRCKVVICNDTGGMHLANALGTPVVAIFGPTNPIRTGPIFDTKKIILQPDECPPTGGLPIKNVTVPQVFQAMEKLINQSNNGN